MIRLILLGIGSVLLYQINNKQVKKKTHKIRASEYQINNKQVKKKIHKIRSSEYLNEIPDNPFYYLNKIIEEIKDNIKEIKRIKYLNKKEEKKRIVHIKCCVDDCNERFSIYLWELYQDCEGMGDGYNYNNKCFIFMDNYEHFFETNEFEVMCNSCIKKSKYSVCDCCHYAIDSHYIEETKPYGSYMCGNCIDFSCRQCNVCKDLYEHEDYACYDEENKYYEFLKYGIVCHECISKEKD